MRKAFIIMVLLLNIFTVVNAATLSISPSNNTLKLNDVIKIDYYVSFARTTVANITIGLSSSTYNTTLFTSKMDSQVKKDSITWNVNKTPAGKYELYIKVFPLDSSEQKSSEQIVIEPTALISAEYDSSPIFIFSQDGSKIVKLKNEGNVPLNIIPEFVTTPLSEVTPEPTTFNLPISGEKNVDIKIKKAETDYSFTLKFKGTNVDYPDNTATASVLFDVIKPRVNITWSVGNFLKQDNNTIVPINISNYGNFDQNISIIVKTFSPKKISVFNKTIFLETNADIERNVSITSTDKIFFIEINYVNENNETKYEFKRYPIFFGITLPDTILNLIILIYSNKSIRGIFLSIVIVVLLMIVFKILKKIFFFCKKRK